MEPVEEGATAADGALLSVSQRPDDRSFLRAEPARGGSLARRGASSIPIQGSAREIVLEDHRVYIVFPTHGPGVDQLLGDAVDRLQNR